uniref:Plexin-A4 n=2 Tax=Cacopsylla melanoneura TaxID=428564 RepID=A0A8D8XKE0_9HEMI
MWSAEILLLLSIPIAFTSSTLPGVQSTTDTFLANVSVIPNPIRLGEIDSIPFFHVTLENYFEKNLKIPFESCCFFTIANETVWSYGTKRGKSPNLNCPNPIGLKDLISKHSTEYQKINVTLSVRRTNESGNIGNCRSHDTELLATISIPVINCTAKTSCTECTSFLCSWCVNEHRCLNPKNNCNGPKLSEIDSCPMINGNHLGSSEIVVEFNTSIAIAVKVNNIYPFMKQTHYNFKCKFYIEGDIKTVKTTLIDDVISCDSMEFSYSSNVSNINASFVVLWGESELYNPNDVHVNIYNCQNFASNCGLCLILNEKYKCGWCQDSHRCEISDHCNGLGMWLSRNQTCSIPEITSFHPKSGPWEGGTNVTINGINLGNDFKDIKDDVSVAGIPCQPYVSMYNQTTQIVCQVEHLRGNKSTEGPVTVRIRDFTVQSKDNYQFVDPIIRSISPMQGPSYGGTTLHITGFHLNAGSSIEAFIDNLPCRVISVEYEGAYCITSASDRHGKFKFKIKFDKGTRYLNDGFFEYVEVEDGNVESVALKIAILTIVFLISIGFLNAFQRNFIENTRDLKSIRNRIKILELRVAAECRETFGELQTELTDLREELKTSGIPFLDYRTYAMMILFPNSEHHAVLQFERPELLHKEKGLRLFGQLIMNKTFLLLFIRTLESNRYFSMRDRVNVASLIMLVLQTKMEYCTDILKTLLAQLIDKFMKEKSNPYLLLRQTESVAEKMLSSWFTFLLYNFVRECAGHQLYLLFLAIKQQVDKGPVDDLTGEARYCLSEEKMIRQVFDFKPMTVNVSINCEPITQSSTLCTVKVLDCDTISQVKEKSLDTFYHTKPYSQRHLKKDDLDLKWQTGNTGSLILNDNDITNEKDGEWRKVNTLNHYRVPDGGRLALDLKEHHSPIIMSNTPLNQSTTGINTTDADKDLEREWHLVKQHDNDNQKEGERCNKVVSEVYLTRLLTTKGILQNYVDNLFMIIFSTSSENFAFPFAIKYMFDFLDNQATCHGITDPKIVHTWKSNALPLRFWVNLIKNPNFVFDIHKSNTLDTCLGVLAHTFMDSCSTSDPKFDQNLPSSDILYAKDIPAYKEKVQQYYSDIKSLPVISDEQLNAKLAEESELHESELSTNSALNELYKYATKYNEQLTLTLEEDEVSKMQGLGIRLMEVHSSMMASNDTSTET